ncbi:MAG: helix-turn-helix domain-containing protein, partial [Sedimentisphaerales bacterium]|nr:helix-turn-helix domain-containing protein [Sedimentisphaerales bacterium]
RETAGVKRCHCINRWESDMKLFSTVEIARMFGLSNDYLRKLRQLRAGPKYIKIGKMVRYRSEDVQSWLDTVAVEIVPERLTA